MPDLDSVGVGRHEFIRVSTVELDCRALLLELVCRLRIALAPSLDHVPAHDGVLVFLVTAQRHKQVAGAIEAESDDREQVESDSEQHLSFLEVPNYQRRMDARALRFARGEQLSVFAALDDGDEPRVSLEVGALRLVDCLDDDVGA